MPSEELRQAAEEILAYPGTFAEESACLKHGPALARAAIAMLAATASPSLEACVANLEAVGSEWRAIEIVKRHWPIAPVPASLGACVAEIRNSPHKVGPLTLIDRCVEIVSRRWPTAPAVEPSEPTDHTLTMSRDDKPEPSDEKRMPRSLKAALKVIDILEAEIDRLNAALKLTANPATVERSEATELAKKYADALKRHGERGIADFIHSQDDEIKRLNELVESTEASCGDEEAAHRGTLRLWERANKENERLREQVTEYQRVLTNPAETPGLINRLYELASEFRVGGDEHSAVRLSTVISECTQPNGVAE